MTETLVIVHIYVSGCRYRTEVVGQEYKRRAFHVFLSSRCVNVAIVCSTECKWNQYNIETR